MERRQYLIIDSVIVLAVCTFPPQKPLLRYRTEINLQLHMVLTVEEGEVLGSGGRVVVGREELLVPFEFCILDSYIAVEGERFGDLVAEVLTLLLLEILLV